MQSHLADVGRQALQLVETAKTHAVKEAFANPNAGVIIGQSVMAAEEVVQAEILYDGEARAYCGF